MEVQFWIINSIAVLAVSMLCTCLLIPGIMAFAFSNNVFDRHDGRKCHSGDVPRLGGLVFVPVIVLSVLLTGVVNDFFGLHSYVDELLRQWRPLMYGGVAVFILYLTGMADDFFGVGYQAKFSVQIFATLLLLVGGGGVETLCGLMGVYQLGFWWHVAITFAFSLMVINATNLIDGIDGLASGLTVVALGVYTPIFAMTGAYMEMLISLSALGVVIVFFYFNVFGQSRRRRRRVFMGDTGSLTLGFILVALSSRVLQLDISSIRSEINPLVIAMSPLVVMCFDTIRVFMERVVASSDPFMPDRRHIHYMLMEAGIGHHATMVAIVMLSLAITALNMLVSLYAVDVVIVVVLDVCVYCGVMTCARRRIAALALQTNR